MSMLDFYCALAVCVFTTALLVIGFRAILKLWSDPEREIQEPWYGAGVAGFFEKILGAWRNGIDAAFNGKAEQGCHRQPLGLPVKGNYGSNPVACSSHAAPCLSVRVDGSPTPSGTIPLVADSARAGDFAQRKDQTGGAALVDRTLLLPREQGTEVIADALSEIPLTSNVQGEPASCTPGEGSAETRDSSRVKSVSDTKEGA